MRKTSGRSRAAAFATLVTAALVVVVTDAANAPALPAAAPAYPGFEGTIWVGNRGQPNRVPAEVVAYDAATGELTHSVQLPAAVSDLATGKGKVFVGDETNHKVWIIDGSTGGIWGSVATGAQPHHLSSSRGGNLIAYAAFGTNEVGVIDASTGEQVGEWEASKRGDARVHAAAFSPNAHIVLTANDFRADRSKNEVGAVEVATGTLLWTVEVPHAHELIVSADGSHAFVSSRGANKVRRLDLLDQDVSDFVDLTLPDTLQLSADGRQLTVGLRKTDVATLAAVDTQTGSTTTFGIPGGTLAGHQWTSTNGHLTYVAYEGAVPGTAVIDHREDIVAETLPYPTSGQPPSDIQPHGLAYLAPSGG